MVKVVIELGDQVRLEEQLLEVEAVHQGSQGANPALPGHAPADVEEEQRGEQTKG